MLPFSAAVLVLDSLKCTLAAKNTEVADCRAKTLAIKEEAQRMQRKLEATELRLTICNRDNKELISSKSLLEESHAKALRDLAEVQNALTEKEAQLQASQALQEETKLSCVTTTSCLAEEYAKLQGELEVAKMTLAPYMDEDEEKEVVCLDTNLIPQLEEEQREKIRVLFEAQIVALKEVLEKPRGTCGGANCPGRKEDPKDDGAAGKRNTPSIEGRNGEAEVNTLTVEVVPSSSKNPAGGE